MRRVKATGDGFVILQTGKHVRITQGAVIASWGSVAACATALVAITVVLTSMAVPGQRAVDVDKRGAENGQMKLTTVSGNGDVYAQTPDGRLFFLFGNDASEVKFPPADATTQHIGRNGQKRSVFSDLPDQNAPQQ